LSLELLNTIATLATCIIIATTAIAALVQLRHLRASNQIAGQLSINAMIQSGEFVRSQLIIAGLPAMIGDPKLAWAFRVPISPALPPEVVEMRAAARVVGSNLENIGNMIRHGLTDGQLFVEQFGNVVSDAWEMLEPYARVRRKFEASHDAVWEDFERLTILSRDWTRDHPTAFPHTRRLLPPWQELEVVDISERRDDSRIE
jgi:hypothetical protein